MSVKLDNAITFQMLHCVVAFENITSCCNIVFLQHDVARCCNKWKTNLAKKKTKKKQEYF